MRVKSGQKYLDKIAHIFILLFLFFYFLFGYPPGRKCGLPTIWFFFFFLGLTGRWILFIYFKYDDVWIGDTP